MPTDQHHRDEVPLFDLVMGQPVPTMSVLAVEEPRSECPWCMRRDGREAHDLTALYPLTKRKAQGMPALQISPDLPDGTVSPEKARAVTELFRLGKRARAAGDPAKRARLNEKYDALFVEVRNAHGPGLWR